MCFKNGAGLLPTHRRGVKTGHFENGEENYRRNAALWVNKFTNYCSQLSVHRLKKEEKEKRILYIPNSKCLSKCQRKKKRDVMAAVIT